jgi:XTP/dITP diphosphohydrolase
LTTTGGSRPRLLVATHSEPKLRELRQLLALPNAELVSLDDVGVPDEPVEDAETFEGNAAIKARAGLAASGLPTLADDSGLEVDALDGAPGVRTRRYAGEDATDDQNNQKLLAALEGLPPDRRGAHYVCALVLAMPDAPLITVRGECFGRIATGPRGTGGFGYDPIFEPEGEPPGGRTFGQWSADDKNRVSHRARAAHAMTPHLVERGF